MLLSIPRVCLAVNTAWKLTIQSQLDLTSSIEITHVSTTHRHYFLRYLIQLVKVIRRRQRRLKRDKENLINSCNFRCLGCLRIECSYWASAPWRWTKPSIYHRPLIRRPETERTTENPIDFYYPVLRTWRETNNIEQRRTWSRSGSHLFSHLATRASKISLV